MQLYSIRVILGYVWLEVELRENRIILENCTVIFQIR